MWCDELDYQGIFLLCSNGNLPIHSVLMLSYSDNMTRVIQLHYYRHWTKRKLGRGCDDNVSLQMPSKTFFVKMYNCCGHSRIRSHFLWMSSKSLKTWLKYSSSRVLGYSLLTVFLWPWHRNNVGRKSCITQNCTEPKSQQICTMRGLITKATFLLMLLFAECEITTTITYLFRSSAKITTKMWIRKTWLVWQLCHFTIGLHTALPVRHSWLFGEFGVFERLGGPNAVNTTLLHYIFNK